MPEAGGEEVSGIVGGCLICTGYALGELSNAAPTCEWANGSVKEASERATGENDHLGAAWFEPGGVLQEPELLLLVGNVKSFRARQDRFRRESEMSVELGDRFHGFAIDLYARSVWVPGRLAERRGLGISRHPSPCRKTRGSTRAPICGIRSPGTSMPITWPMILARRGLNPVASDTGGRWGNAR